LAEGGKKDAPYLANMIMPHIATIESSTNESNKIQQGVVDLVLFDGASNVQKARRIVAIHHAHHRSAWCRACDIFIF
jgi:hypothetical protein